MKRAPFLLVVLAGMFGLHACSNQSSNEGSQGNAQGILSGSAELLCDETVFPIIEDEANVFKGVYRNTGLDIVSMPEMEVINGLRRGDAQLAVITRELTTTEDSMFRARKITPRVSSFATDALAIVTSKANPDSMLTDTDVIDMVKGKRQGKILVFDHKNSSALRYFMELAGIDSINNREGVYAVNGTLELLKYVEGHKNAYGVMGLNWLYQPSDEMRTVMENVQVVGLKQASKDSTVYYKPSQSNLALNLYPFKRKLYLVNVQGKNAVGMGFAAFLYDERGQKVVLKSGLLPDSIPSRELIIRN
ncbi:PstS family phosphate ABC transporter substrate-binding protein [Olivibacter sitiensis]|uniref:PstS family phosphate ABC transporter substrate-binding protein n=1 Tax=Olivibacter sitiensis TaxID=376470 RepID=UPI0004877AEE|nr:substrate-binding domain-containing protein [Olivibacter sitiensis]